MIKTNMPNEPILFVDNAIFRKGDRIRIMKGIMGGYIGEIVEIKHESIILNVGMYPGCNSTEEVNLFDIKKIRCAEPNETFNTVPYFDAEEKEFWRTHWYTHDGIKKKTPEDIKMLEDLSKKIELKYLRLFRIAREYLSEIAEGLLETIYNDCKQVTTWYTLDGEKFTDKLEAIDHQINYLLEEE